MEYGAGAIFGCPAHDQRDLEFARKYASGRAGGAASGRGPERFTIGDEAYLGDGRLINSDF